MSKFTTALAACGIHHVAIPKNNRKSSDWDCPYCRIAELEVKLETYRKIDKKRFTAMTELEEESNIWKDVAERNLEAWQKTQAQLDKIAQACGGLTGDELIEDMDDDAPVISTKRILKILEQKP